MPPQDKTLLEKQRALRHWFTQFESCLVAFSGGVDSSVVAATARSGLGEGAVAATAETATLAPEELLYATNLAAKIGIRHIVVHYDDLENERLVENSPARCYYCREDLSSHLTRIATDEGLDVIVDGTLLDDLYGHRPGVRALDKAGIRHPLCEVGLGKSEVRALARLLELPSADKPSDACLASRFQYGERITREGLQRVAIAESYVRQVTGAKQLRVRVHGADARIEVAPPERHLLFNAELMDQIAAELRKMGFVYVSLDLQGYRSGSADEMLGGQFVPVEKLTWRAPNIP